MQRKEPDEIKIENIISKRIIGGAIDVHKIIGGPGLLESVYEEALACELADKGMIVIRQKSVPIMFRNRQLSTPLRLDLLIDDLVIVECKATIKYNPIFETQLLTYLRLTNLRLGLIISFGEKYVKDGVRRVVNGL